MNDKRRAIVIGAGVAGLATSVRLASQGWQVQVFEQNDYPGGKLSWFQQDGFSFDAGPSLFTQPQLLEQLFADAGEPISNYFEYRRADESCRYFFENGKRLTAWADVQALAQAMEVQLGEPAQNVLRYLRSSGRTYQHVGQLFLQQSLHRLRQFPWAKVAPALRHSRPSLLFGSLHGYNKRHFKTPEAVQIFDRYATYNGSNPYKAPGMLSLIPHLEMNEGTYYPRGGMISITQALHQLAVAKGVQFHFSTPVDRIIENGGQVSGVAVGGQNVQAEVVVSNCDAYFTYQRLLQSPYEAKRLLRQERSSSALIFYWGIGQQFHELGLHNIFFSQQYAREFEHLFRHKNFFPDPTVYVNITSKMEEGQAPAGMENWFVMVNAPAHHGQPWQQWIPQVRQRVIDKLSKALGADIASLIRTEAILDPPTIEQRTASFQGSLYGTSSNSRLAAFLRHPNTARRRQGLYLVGGSVHPGGGIPLCMQSAAITANLIAHDYKQEGHAV